jgi:hypothetical protein
MMRPLHAWLICNYHNKMIMQSWLIKFRNQRHIIGYDEIF